MNFTDEGAQFFLLHVHLPGGIELGLGIRMLELGSLWSAFSGMELSTKWHSVKRSRAVWRTSNIALFGAVDDFTEAQSDGHVCSLIFKLRAQS